MWRVWRPCWRSWERLLNHTKRLEKTVLSNLKWKVLITSRKNADARSEWGFLIHFTLSTQQQHQKSTYRIRLHCLIVKTSFGYRTYKNAPILWPKTWLLILLDKFFGYDYSNRDKNSLLVPIQVANFHNPFPHVELLHTDVLSSRICKKYVHFKWTSGNACNESSLNMKENSWPW